MQARVVLGACPGLVMLPVRPKPSMTRSGVRLRVDSVAGDIRESDCRLSKYEGQHAALESRLLLDSK